MVTNSPFKRRSDLKEGNDMCSGRQPGEKDWKATSEWNCRGNWRPCGEHGEIGNCWMCWGLCALGGGVLFLVFFLLFSISVFSLFCHSFFWACYRTNLAILVSSWRGKWLGGGVQIHMEMGFSNWLKGFSAWSLQTCAQNDEWCLQRERVLLSRAPSVRQLCVCNTHSFVGVLIVCCFICGLFLVNQRDLLTYFLTGVSYPHPKAWTSIQTHLTFVPCINTFLRTACKIFACKSTTNLCVHH